MLAWLSAFVFTQVVEVCIYVPCLRSTLHAPQRFAIAFMASTLTHPIVWFVFPLLIEDPFWMTVAAESFAVLAEAAWLHRFETRRALLVALISNMTSMTLGLSSRYLFGWP